MGIVKQHFHDQIVAQQEECSRPAPPDSADYPRFVDEDGIRLKVYAEGRDFVVNLGSQQALELLFQLFQLVMRQLRARE
jgi:hypothetical protein